MDDIRLDKFTTAYISIALDLVECPHASDKHRYEIADIDRGALDQIIKDCADFQVTFGEIIADKADLAGHDFYLTRNREGAGFWDGDWSYPVDLEVDGDLARFIGKTRIEDVGNFLTSMSHSYGYFNLVVYRGKVYCYP